MNRFYYVHYKEKAVGITVNLVRIYAELTLQMNMPVG